MKKEKKKEKVNIKTILIVLLVVSLIIGLFVYSCLPALSAFRNSIYGKIIKIIIILLLISVFTIKKPILIPLGGRIIIWIYGLIYIITTFINNVMISYILLVLYALANAIISLYYYIKKGETNYIFIFGAMALIGIIRVLLKVTYVDDRSMISSTFMIPSIIVAALSMVITMIIVFTKYKKQMIMILMVPIVAFVAAWLLMVTANVCLDTSKPIKEKVQIVDKDIYNGYRQPMWYVLFVKKGDQTIKINVSDKTYSEYAIDDEIEISMYPGLFLESYYVYEG